MYQEERRVRVSVKALKRAQDQVQAALNELTDIEDSDVEVHRLVGQLEHVRDDLKDWATKLDQHG
jgi:chaperonin cofactor prefoldin